MAKQASDLSPTSGLQSFSPFTPLNSRCFYIELNEAGDPPADPPPSDPPADPPPTDPPADPPPKDPKSTDGRISDLVKTNKELQEKLDAIEVKEKKAAEDKLKEDGKLQELLDSKETELSEATGSKAALEEQVKHYEEIAEQQIASALEGIEDEEKKKSVDALLEGKTTLEKQKMLPEVLKLIGSESNGGFGGNTPASSKSPGKTSAAQKNARFMELNEKERKETLSAAELAEKENLMEELQDASWE